MPRTKQERKKPTHSVLSNYLWSVKMLCRYSKTAFFLLSLFVPLHIGMKYLEIRLPSLVVSEVTTGQTRNHALLAVGTLLLLMLLAQLLLKTLEHIKQATLEQYRLHMTDRVTRKHLSLFYQSYERKETRDLAIRANRTIEMWNGTVSLHGILTGGFGMLENLLGYLLFGGIVSLVSPWLLPLLTLGPVVNLLALRAYNNWEYAHRSEVTDLDSKLGFVEELPDDFSLAKDIRIYSLASWLTACYHDLSAERARWDKKQVLRHFLARTADLVVILIRDGGAYALLLTLFYRGEITVDRFVLYFAAIASFSGWVSGIIQSWNTAHTASLNLCDFRDYTTLPDPDNGTLSVDAHLTAAPEIEFDHVTFRYENAETDTLHDLSFRIAPGEKLALVGMNGAGKTTIVKLLCGLYRPTAGTIRLNGIPIQQFRREEYYRLISPVFQNIRTAFFTLAETVSGKKLAETDLTAAEACMRTAGLGEKLDSLSDGILTKLNKQVNADGTELSGGEAQKLMLARALYKNAPLLILDEPTAALDPIAESKIYDQYHHMAQNKTSLFISHRLASTAFCDRVILLEDGAIAEEGSHNELLSLGGRYRELFDIQSCWYKDTNEEHEKPEGGEAL